ncbi:MAG: fibronectin/fibrinogen-binding protein [Ruminococcaceae bacterium]|nr:fibronectin/fibrinogen-binding protein [Oscillospiraceae bacterium]
MAFDAGMLAATLSEIRKKALGARIEKVYQPERDEIILQMRSLEGGKRLLINAGSNNPRIGFTSIPKENPQNPPMFCMLLRKYLQGAKLVEVSQADFDRIAFLKFETRDEMGFECTRVLVAELMGKYSNLLFCDGDMKIISALKTADFSLDSVRQLLAGGAYSLPSSGGKVSPISVSEEALDAIFAAAPEGLEISKIIMKSFSGVSPAVAREISFAATGRTDTALGDALYGSLKKEFMSVFARIREENFSPAVVLDGDTPVEYSFIPLSQYGSFEVRSYESAGEMLDEFFESRDRQCRVRQRAADILRLLTNAETRIRKKLDLQRGELLDCEKGEEYKKFGDLITANIYRLSRGDRFAELCDYESMDEEGNFATLRIELDTRLTPAANAQRYYKRYNKTKTAKTELTRQIALGEAELEYIYTVFESLTKAETPTDLSEIREELYRAGYASRMKGYDEQSKKKTHNFAYMQFVTEDGMTVLCGKNNAQNDHITHRVAEKRDYWFHAKNTAGSHAILVTEGKEPTDKDFTTAAEIAALYSKAEGQNIAVDYTLAKNIKKPTGAKPGFVIYHTNYTAYVSPDPKKIASLRKK